MRIKLGALASASGNKIPLNPALNGYILVRIAEFRGLTAPLTQQLERTVEMSKTPHDSATPAYLAAIPAVSTENQDRDTLLKVIYSTRLSRSIHKFLVMNVYRDHAGQERHFSKLSCSILDGTSFSDLADGLQLGAEVIGVVVPGFPLVFTALKAIHAVASSFLGCTEESARLMSYCAAMATALSRFTGKVRETPALMEALNEAAAALKQLRDLIDEHKGQSTIVKMFTSVSYKTTSERVKQDVEKAVRKAMDEAQMQGMEDAATTRDNVEVLLKRRYVRAGIGGAVGHSSCAAWRETAGLLICIGCWRQQREARTAHGSLKALTVQADCPW